MSAWQALPPGRLTPWSQPGSHVFRYKDRSNIDGLLFQIIAKQKANGQRSYVPKEGLLLKDVESAWNRLEKSEHERELALRAELLR